MRRVRKICGDIFLLMRVKCHTIRQLFTDFSKDFIVAFAPAKPPAKTRTGPRGESGKDGKGKSEVSRALYDRVMTPNYAPLAIMPARGEGSRLWDTDGKVYLDFAAGIAVSVLGHAHPQLRKVLAEQADKLWHVSNLLANEPAVELAQRLCDITFAERVFFANSGAEVNEAALKLARRYARDHFGPGKEEIIAFNNAFHGRTFFTVCVGGQRKYSDGFGPKPGGITHLSFNDVDALGKAVDESTCAVILEPIQGEGGVTPVSAEFVRAARELCERHGALLILDEIQTGVGRSGFLYMYQKLGVTPDILTTAKGLAGGFPIGAMLTTEAVARSLAVGTHGSTFGGNPMACAVANKVLEIVNTPQLLGRVRATGALLRQGLEAINGRQHAFAEIRGEGLLLGCALAAPFTDRARDILNACIDRRLLLLMAGQNVLRFAPALTISEEEIAEGLRLLEAAIAEVTAKDGG